MEDSVLRSTLATLLAGHGAHVTLDTALEGIPRELRTAVPQGFVHSIWQLVEHIRLAQEDILRYTLEPGWESPPWPEGYWPSETAAQVDDQAWAASVAAIRRDLAAAVKLVQDPAVDLTAAIPHGVKGHTTLREALLIADHNAYHAAQIVDVRRALGAWSPA